MAWSRERKLEALMALPWTILAEAGDDPGERVLRVLELPDVIVTGTTQEELERDFWESLEASLDCYLEADARPPLPEYLHGAPLPWEVEKASAAAPSSLALTVETSRILRRQRAVLQETPRTRMPGAVQSPGELAATGA